MNAQLATHLTSLSKSITMCTTCNATVTQREPGWPADWRWSSSQGGTHYRCCCRLQPTRPSYLACCCNSSASNLYCLQNIICLPCSREQVHGCCFCCIELPLATHCIDYKERVHEVAESQQCRRMILSKTLCVITNLETVTITRNDGHIGAVG